MARTLPGRIVTALADQRVTIPATQQYGRVIRGLADQLLTVLGQRDILRGELEELLEAHPLAEILTSMPGVGPRTAIELLRTVGDGSAFPSAAHIASTPDWRRLPDSPGGASRASTNPAAGTGP